MIKVSFMVASIILCFGGPIGWFLVLRKGERGYFGVLVAGAMSFYLTQMVIRIPLLQLILPKMTWYQSLSESILGMALFLGLTAAIFETAGRWLTLNFLLKKRLSYRTGLVHGVGHGGIEAILLVGINYIIYAAYTFLYTRGVENPMMFMFPEEAQTMMKTLIIDAESNLFLVAGIERVLTMIVHVALSLLIAVGIMKKQQWYYIIIVVIIHGSLDFFAVVMSSSGISFWMTELMVLAYAVLSIGILMYFKGKVKDSADEDEGEKAVEEGY